MSLRQRSVGSCPATAPLKQGLAGAVQRAVSAAVAAAAAARCSVRLPPRCLTKSRFNTSSSADSASAGHGLTGEDCLADRTEKNILCFSAVFSNYSQLIPSFFDF